MSVRISTKGLKNKIKKEVKGREKRARSQIASVMNKETRAVRKEIVESLMVKTKLKRKVFNDRLSISRANPSRGLVTRITPIFGKRIYMMDYPWARTVARAGRAVIRLLSPIYRKNMRTGFLSQDKTRMYLRGEGGVRSVKGRSIPRLWDQFKIKEKYTRELMQRIRKAIKEALK